MRVADREILTTESNELPKKLASKPQSKATDLDTEEAGAPRPLTPSEIVAMMDEAASKKVRPVSNESEVSDGSFLNAATFWLLWLCIFAGAGALAYFMLSPVDAAGYGVVFAIAAASVAGLFAVSLAANMRSPMLMAGAMLNRTDRRQTNGQLAGADILGALGLAERVLDADQDARLITRRDGVVTYANRAYFDLAQEAGVAGPAGLPPRIDRLFAQQGAEATKVFRLCRAAKSAETAEENIYQIMGLEGGGRRRRFEVSVGPIRGSEDHVIWRLRDLPVDEEEHDVLAAAYADFTRGVFALERSGQIAWANASLRKELGVGRGDLRSIEDIVLGETGDLMRALWQIDRMEQTAMVRRVGADPIEAAFTAFRRGGVGEGFVCVELVIDEPKEETEELSLSGRYF